MPDDEKKPTDEKPSDGDDVKPDPNLIEYVGEGIKEGREIRKRGDETEKEDE